MDTSSIRASAVALADKAAKAHSAADAIDFAKAAGYLADAFILLDCKDRGVPLGYAEPTQAGQLASAEGSADLEK